MINLEKIIVFIVFGNMCMCVLLSQQLMA